MEGIEEVCTCTRHNVVWGVSSSIGSASMGAEREEARKQRGVMEEKERNRQVCQGDGEL